MSFNFIFRSLTFFTLFIPFYGQTIINPTISNSSGDYFISQKDDDFGFGEIKCHSNTYCYVQCAHHGSCSDIDIDCNEAALCIIDCNGGVACSESNLYVSSKNTQINCQPTHDSSPYSCQSSIIYTDPINYPSSTTILRCGYFSCVWMKILNVETPSVKTGYVDATNFKIFCQGAFGGCDLSLSRPYPMALPNVINETGEYYENIGSFVNITCSHNLLCSINCSDDSCRSSYIHCNGSSVCLIHCGGSRDAACDNLEIKATKNDIFQIDCRHTGDFSCESGTYWIEDVKMVYIQTQTKFGGYKDSQFHIKNVEDLQVQCDSTWSCDNTLWYIDNNTNVTISNYGSLNNAEFQIINTAQVDIFCGPGGYLSRNYPESCQSITINGYASNIKDFKINLFCMAEKSCQDSKISVYGEFDANCCGNSSCDRMEVDDAMDPSMMLIDCGCGGFGACTNLTTFHVAPIQQTTLSLMTTTGHIKEQIVSPINIINTTNETNGIYAINGHVQILKVLFGSIAILVLIIAVGICYFCHTSRKKKLNKGIMYIQEDLVNKDKDNNKISINVTPWN